MHLLQYVRTNQPAWKQDGRRRNDERDFENRIIQAIATQLLRKFFTIILQVGGQNIRPTFSFVLPRLSLRVDIVASALERPKEDPTKLRMGDLPSLLQY